MANVFLTEKNIEAVDFDVRLGVYGIRKAGELGDPAETGNEVFLDFPSAGSTPNILVILQETFNIYGQSPH